MRSDVGAAIEKFEIDIRPWYERTRVGQSIAKGLAKLHISVESEFEAKKSIERAESVLKYDETVLFVISTFFTISGSKKIPGIFFLTDSRAIFHYSNEPVTPSNILDSIPLSEVRSIDYNVNHYGILYINIYTLTKSYRFFVVGIKKYFDLVRQVFENAINNYKSQQSSQSLQSNDSQPDIINQIERIAELKDKGIITEEEFQTKKADLLARL